MTKQFTVNANELSKTLHVDQLARDYAFKNLPGSEENVPDANEQHIGREIRQVQQLANNHYDQQLRQQQDQQEKALIQTETIRFEECVEKAKVTYKELQALRTDALVEAQRTFNHTLCELNVFRHKHNLKRKAVQPKSPFLHIVIFMFMGMIEGVANSFFFADGSSYGLLGGLQLALIVAAINIAVSGFAGVMLRDIFHVSVKRRFCGFLVGFSYVVFLINFHLAIGHFRMALQGGEPEYAASEAIESFLLSPFAINDIQSWMLVTVGIMFGICALIAGMKLKDRYPGYTDVYRRFKSAEEKLNKFKNQYRAKQKDLYDMHVTMVENRYTESNEAVTQFRDSLANSRKLVNQYNASSSLIHDIFVSLIQQYRKTNEEARSDKENTPSYFQEKPVRFDLSEYIDIRRYQIDHAETISRSFHARIIDLRNVADSVNARLLEFYQQCLKETPSFFTHIETLVISKSQNRRPSKPKLLEYAKKTTHELTPTIIA